MTNQSESRPNIITLCGSSRFIDAFAVLAWELEKRGNIVLSLHLLPGWYSDVGDHLAEAQGVADQLDALHLEKIRMSDEVIVLDIGGYIGESTSKEIAFAESRRKPIRYLSKNMDLLGLIR